MACALHAWATNQWEITWSVTYSTDIELSKRYLLHPTTFLTSDNRTRPKCLTSYVNITLFSMTGSYNICLNVFLP